MAGTITETAFTLGHVRSIEFACVGDSVTGSFLDYFVQTKFEGRLLRFVANPGALASLSPSASASRSASVSASASTSISPSASASMSSSLSASHSSSGSSSLSPSASASLSASRSASASSSLSLSPSASISASRSASASASLSLSPSASISPSSSLSASTSASPSAGSPTDNWDCQIFDQHGLDVLRGLGMNLDQATPFDAPVVFAGTSVHVPIAERDVLRLKIGDNLVASAQMTLTLYYAPGA